jgi:hypothetical protein
MWTIIINFVDYTERYNYNSGMNNGGMGNAGMNTSRIY